MSSCEGLAITSWAAPVRDLMTQTCAPSRLGNSTVRLPRYARSGRSPPPLLCKLCSFAWRSETSPKPGGTGARPSPNDLPELLARTTCPNCWPELLADIPRGLAGASVSRFPCGAIFSHPPNYVIAVTSTISGRSMYCRQLQGPMDLTTNSPALRPRSGSAQRSQPLYRQAFNGSLVG